MLTTIAILLAMAPTPSGALAADPIAPAWAGQAQCYAPKVATKACASIGAYARDARGVIKNTAEVLLSVEPRIVMTTVAPVEIKGAAICGVIRQLDLDTAIFALNGALADNATAAAIRRSIAPGYASVLNREVCSTEVKVADGLVAQVTIDGARRPELDQPIRWISPAEGYAVKP
jgi:hypothetical protein